MTHPTWNTPPPVDGQTRVHFRWIDTAWWKLFRFAHGLNR